MIDETQERIFNGLTEVYVNARVKDGTPASDLLRVFTENDNYDRKFPKTAEIKRRLKCTEEGLTYMSIRMNEYREQFLAEGEAKGRADTMNEVAAAAAELVKSGQMSFDSALMLLHMTEEEFSCYCTRHQPDSL